MTFHLGIFVIIKGLEKAPIYNGILGLIVEEKNEEGRYGVQLLDHAEGWKEEVSATKNQQNAKLAVGGKILAVKEANLEKANRDSPYWRIAQNDKMSILERVRLDPNLAYLDRCDELTKGIWDCFFETIPGMPLTLDDKLHFRREIVNNSKGHKAYWLMMDAIQHHLIIEKCRGRYRIFQAFVDEAPVAPEYTAKDWCCMDKTTLVCTKVHKIYGGGRTVGDKEINQLLDYIKELQIVADKLLPHLLKNVPGLDQSAIDMIKGDPTSFSSEELNFATEKLELAVAWSNNIESIMAGPLGLSTLNVVFDYPDKAQVHGDSACIFQGDNEVFDIPKNMYLRVHRLYHMLTGQTILSPVIFLRMLNSGAYWKHRRSPDGGGVGFTIRQADFNLVQSYEEGIEAARERTARMQSTLP